ncbi:hypothetical protein ACFL47_05815 [Candidatus Latescibacterota bacterium]
MNFDKIDSVFSYKINNLSVKTGDLICTVDGGGPTISGHFWWAIGKLIPGIVDHIVIYTGPEGRCVEAGAKKRVITFNVPESEWDAETMKNERGFVDRLYGVAYPLADSSKKEAEERAIRIDVANYCIKQARLQKPYNINFFKSKTEKAFYCSQLAYKAYKRHGINFNTNKGIPDIPFTDRIIYPQEVWEACTVRKLHN